MVEPVPLAYRRARVCAPAESTVNETAARPLLVSVNRPT